MIRPERCPSRSCRSSKLGGAPHDRDALERDRRAGPHHSPHANASNAVATRAVYGHHGSAPAAPSRPPNLKLPTDALGRSHFVLAALEGRLWMRSRHPVMRQWRALRSSVLRPENTKRIMSWSAATPSGVAGGSGPQLSCVGPHRRRESRQDRRVPRRRRHCSATCASPTRRLCPGSYHVPSMIDCSDSCASLFRQK